MENLLELAFPPALDRQIERLHRQAIELRQAIARPTARKRRDRERLEELERKLALTERLIAEYSQLGAQIAIDGELPEYIAESRRLEQLERQGEKRALAIDPDKIQWFRRQIKAWFRENRRDFPWRETQNPYHILIAEILLTRTRSENVVPVYRSFLVKYPTVEDLAKAPLADIEKAIAPLGFDFRAGQLHRSAERIVSLYGGKIPDNEKDLITLPGVGRYTLNAVLATAFGQRAPVVDTNVVRILERFFGLEGRGEKSRDSYLWDAAEAIAPKRNTKAWNWTLIDFGALVCAPNPRCSVCPLKKRCNFDRKG
jgi:A/G-specific adenine glycosylase